MMDFAKIMELISSHGRMGFLLFVFIYLLFILTIVNIHNTLLYKTFVIFNPEKKLLTKIKSLRRISRNDKISEDIRALAKNEEIRTLNSFYLKCNLSVDVQNVWAKLILFHKNKNISMESYKKVYSLFPVKNSRLEKEIGFFYLVKTWVMTIIQTILFLVSSFLGALSLAASLNIVGGEGSMKLTVYYFSCFILLVVFSAFFSSENPNYFTYKKVKELIKEYNQAH
ncbi:hypothetical protein [Xenorhabdus sp. PB30.3]|uniref:hypothetical protein n=1 Tax=Xenorhabdus sp. PB30.3 TaxID=2788941 RepID=UPI001E568FA9|nr:hypothetical protein [Xenorhabdus sp. PB30.3]MCC8381731.1 hypothetical protein [Xenorhabdus sp. PB30.3]